MATGNYHWGRKAKLTAAAAIAIARRESHKPDSLRTIAVLIHEPHSSLSRSFLAVVNLLSLSLVCTDPSVHLPTLHSHLSSLINSPQIPDPLPRTLKTYLAPLSLPSVLKTAHALSNLLVDTNSFTHLPTPSTACAVLLLALEAETRSSLPNLGDLALHLATHIGVSKAVVMARYKLVYDLVEEWISEVPWLAKVESKNGRSKVAKRVIVARGLADVIQFREEILKKRSEGLQRVSCVLDVDEADDIPKPTTKKRKTRGAFDDASRFLLNPLSAPSSHSPSNTLPSLHHATYLLTASTSTLEATPTRLQLLTAERGEDSIPDEDLFAEGEWEGLLRNEEEREALRIAMGWSDDGPQQEEEEEEDRDGSTCVQGADKRKITSGSKRINAQVLAKLLQGNGSFSEDEDEGEDAFYHGSTSSDGERDPNSDRGCSERDLAGYDPRCEDERHERVVIESGGEVENWYPPSPDRRDVGDRYDEEC
jgi:transcription factor IIIB 90 kDa subunit